MLNIIRGGRQIIGVWLGGEARILESGEPKRAITNKSSSSPMARPKGSRRNAYAIETRAESGFAGSGAARHGS